MYTSASRGGWDEVLEQVASDLASLGVLGGVTSGMMRKYHKSGLAKCHTDIKDLGKRRMHPCVLYVAWRV
jgi:hypothetical protein